MSLNCIIVDDDPMSRQLLETYCDKFAELKLVGSCESVAAAEKVLSGNSIDLIFLDIEMPGANGFNLLEKYAVLPQVIITSSKEEYAFKAFQYQAEDYLRKPVSLDRFRKAIQKIIERPATPSPSETPKNIFIKSEGRFIKINFDDILYIENIGDYVRFHTTSQNYVVYSTLKKLVERLPLNRFMKVHRSFIINLDKIVDIEENSILIDRKVIPVSRANKSQLMDKLNLI